MKTSLPSAAPEADSARAVQSAATALELSRGRLIAVLETSASGKAGRRSPSLGLLMRRIVGIDLDATLRLTAQRHPYRVLALSASAGGLAYLALPRLASGLIVPLLLSEGRLLIHEMLLGWLPPEAPDTGPPERRDVRI